MYILELSTRAEIEVEIVEATLRNLPPNKSKWSFEWRKEFKAENGTIYILRQLGNKKVEGIISIQLINENKDRHKHIKIHLLNIAPNNYGKNGEYDRIAGCLIAFACDLSFLIENNYKGCVALEIKKGNDKLLELYIKKYGATPTRLPLMEIGPKASMLLIDTYLD